MMRDLKAVDPDWKGGREYNQDTAYEENSLYSIKGGKAPLLLAAAGVQTTGDIATGRRRPTLAQLFLQLEIDSSIEIHFWSPC